MQTELTITLKNDETNFKKKFLMYETYTLDPSDPILKACIDQVVKEFGQQYDDMTIRALLQL